MKVAVGSRNPVKVKATKNVLDQIYGEVEVVSIDTDSGVPDQPFGINQTIEGAINRAKNAYSDEFDMSVGIESGLMETPNSITGYIDLQWSAVFDGDKITLGVSSGFEYPPSVIEEVLNGKEVGDVMDKVTGVLILDRRQEQLAISQKGCLIGLKIQSSVF